MDALTAHGYLYLVLLLALAMLGYLVVSAGLDTRPTLPLSHEQILGGAAAVNLLLARIGMLIMPGGGSSLVKVSWDFGAFLGLAAAVVAVAPRLPRCSAPAPAAPRSSRHFPGDIPGEFGIIRRQPFSYSGKRLACGRCSAQQNTQPVKR